METKIYDTKIQHSYCDGKIEFIFKVKDSKLNDYVKYTNQVMNVTKNIAQKFEIKHTDVMFKIRTVDDDFLLKSHKLCIIYTLEKWNST